MRQNTFILFFKCLFFMVFLSGSCHTVKNEAPEIIGSFPLPSEDHDVDSHVFDIHQVERDVNMRDYFSYINSLVEKYRLFNPLLSEHVLVQANDWLIYALECTDYYNQKDLGNTVLDQGDLVVIEKDEILLIPNERWASEILDEFYNTVLEVNIPEFKLRVIEYGEVEHTFNVRVGRNSSNFLATANRLVDLRTKTGTGEIASIDKDPDYINPENGRIYTSTLRDDGIRTKLPRIPFLHPRINGQLYGQLIHTTTNNVTLGKPYSNGCIGLSEGDMWVLYYHAPRETKINIKYQLEITNIHGNKEWLRDIYADSLHRYESAYL